MSETDDSVPKKEQLRDGGKTCLAEEGRAVFCPTKSLPFKDMKPLFSPSSGASLALLAEHYGSLPSTEEDAICPPVRAHVTQSAAAAS